ncbi:MAG: FAD/NAD(P)-binding oxidoreductase, partial [Burkholderiales bacterium]
MTSPERNNDMHQATMPKRREFVKWLSATAGACALGGYSVAGPAQTAARVLVIGAGYSGATAAKYIRLWAPDIKVTLVERNTEFISCPLSNLVLGG